MQILTFSVKQLGLLVALLSFHLVSFALDPVYTDRKTKSAIGGYDTVAYFTEGKPVKGSTKYVTTYQGATWRFSSQENLDKFSANPEKYAPQYGGYCAYAVSRNTTASIKPEYFTVHQGKLYLNYNKGVYKRWIKDKSKHITRANKNWPEVLN